MVKEPASFAAVVVRNWLLIRVRPIRPGGAAAAPEPEMIALDAERRARLIAFVSEGRMPEDVKARIIGQLEEDEVSSETVTRLEARMGS